MRAMRLAAALLLVVGLASACDDPGPLTSPASEPPVPSFSSQNGFEAAGFIPFVSFGLGCEFEIVEQEVVDGVLHITFLNHNIEVSKEELFAGPETNLASGTIDLATGEILSLTQTIQHRPTAVNGTWEVTLDDFLTRKGSLIKVYSSGYGTGDLEGLGIEYMVVLNAKVSATPPDIVCENRQPFLTTGKIFKLD